VALAAVLSAPKSPFRIATELVQRDPAEYSETVCAVMQARHKLDCGVGSEPLLLVNLLWLYRTRGKGNMGASTTEAFTGKAAGGGGGAIDWKAKKRPPQDFFNKYALAQVRMRQLDTSYGHLASRVANAMHPSPPKHVSRKGKKSSGATVDAAAKTPLLNLDIALTPLFGGERGRTTVVSGGGGSPTGTKNMTPREDTSSNSGVLVPSQILQRPPAAVSPPNRLPNTQPEVKARSGRRNATFAGAAVDVDKPFYCFDCHLQCRSRKHLDEHKKSDEHKHSMATLYCAICKLQCLSRENFNVHKSGNKHRKRVELLQTATTGTSMPLSSPVEGLGTSVEAGLPLCSICDTILPPEKSFMVHCEGKRHKKNVELRAAGTSSIPSLPPPDAMSDAPILSWHCSACNITCTSSKDLELHSKGAKHLHKTALYLLQSDEHEYESMNTASLPAFSSNDGFTAASTVIMTDSNRAEAEESAADEELDEEPVVDIKTGASVAPAVGRGPPSDCPVEEMYLRYGLGPAKLGVLRLLLVWCFHDQIVACTPPSKLNVVQTYASNSDKNVSGAEIKNPHTESSGSAAADSTAAAAAERVPRTNQERPSVVVTLEPDDKVPEETLRQLLPKAAPNPGSDVGRRGGAVEYAFGSGARCHYTAAGPDVARRLGNDSREYPTGRYGQVLGLSSHSSRENVAEAAMQLASKLNLDAVILLFKGDLFHPREFTRGFFDANECEIVDEVFLCVTRGTCHDQLLASLGLGPAADAVDEETGDYRDWDSDDEGEPFMNGDTEYGSGGGGQFSKDMSGNRLCWWAPLNKNRMKDVNKCMDNASKAIVATLMNNQLHALTTGCRLSHGDLDLLFGCGPMTDQAAAHQVLLHYGLSAVQRLEFTVREEHAKQTVAFPVDVPNSTVPNLSGNGSEGPKHFSLQLVNNLPLGVMILGQISRPLFGNKEGRK
jgi:hypothetical protein